MIRYFYPLLKLLFFLLGLVSLAGLMSGLTVGFLSIDKLDLEIKKSIGTPEEKRQVMLINSSKLLLTIIFIGRSHFAHFKAAPLAIGYFIAL